MWLNALIKLCLVEIRPRKISLVQRTGRGQAMMRPFGGGVPLVVAYLHQRYPLLVHGESNVDQVADRARLFGHFRFVLGMIGADELFQPLRFVFDGEAVVRHTGCVQCLDQAIVAVAAEAARTMDHKLLVVLQLHCIGIRRSFHELRSVRVQIKWLREA